MKNFANDSDKEVATLYDSIIEEAKESLSPQKRNQLNELDKKEQAPGWGIIKPPKQDFE